VVAVIAAVVVVAVQRATRPVRLLSSQLQQRPEDDLTPLQVEGAPRELRPLLEATNAVMHRLAHLLEHQKRFVRDTAHQLRTPLAVLKTQVQSARRGDVEPHQALQEIGHTVDRATELANQMLALAKVEQLRQDRDVPLTEWAGVVLRQGRKVSALIAERFPATFELALVAALIGLVVGIPLGVYAALRRGRVMSAPSSMLWMLRSPTALRTASRIWSR